MVFAAELAHRRTWSTRRLVDRHREVLHAAGLPARYPASACPELRAAISLDKKARGRSVRFVLLRGLAAPSIVAGPAGGHPGRRQHRADVRRLSAACASGSRHGIDCLVATRRSKGRTRGLHERSEEWHGARPGRPALVGAVVPAPQAGQGQHGRPHQAQARADGQGGRPHVQLRHQGRHRHASTVARCSTCTTTATGYVFMDTSTYDQMIIPETVVGDASNYLLEHHRDRGVHEGNPLYIDLPAVGRARGDLHRARPAGRPQHRRHQARHRRDRPADPGPAVHQHRREGQGRHPRRQLPRPGQMAAPAAKRGSARTKARKRALDILFESDLRRSRSPSCRWPSGDRADPPLATSPGPRRGRRSPPAGHRQRDLRRAGHGLDAGADAAGRSQPRPDRRLEIDHLEVPDAVAVSEAVRLVADLSTDDSPSFVGGVLGAVVDSKAGPAPAADNPS